MESILKYILDDQSPEQKDKLRNFQKEFARQYMQLRTMDSWRPLAFPIVDYPDNPPAKDEICNKKRMANMDSALSAVKTKDEARVEWIKRSSDLDFMMLLCVSEDYIKVSPEAVREMHNHALIERVKLLYDKQIRLQKSKTFEDWIIDCRRSYSYRTAKDYSYNTIDWNFIDDRLRVSPERSWSKRNSPIDWRPKEKMDAELQIALSSNTAFDLFEPFGDNSDLNALNKNNNGTDKVRSAALTEQRSKGNSISYDEREESEIKDSGRLHGDSIGIIKRPVELRHSTHRAAIQRREHSESEVARARFEQRKK